MTKRNATATMARVTGIGGFFFRALDPEALNSVFAAVAPDSNALGPAARTWKSTSA